MSELFHLDTDALAPVLALMIVVYRWRAGFIAVGVLALVWSALWLAFGKMGPFTAPVRATKTAVGVPDETRVPWCRILFSRTFVGCRVPTRLRGIDCSFRPRVVLIDEASQDGPASDSLAGKVWHGMIGACGWRLSLDPPSRVRR